MGEKWLIRGLAVIAGLCLAAVVAIGAYMLWGPYRGGSQTRSVATNSQSVPIGGPFTLVNQAGDTVTDEDFRGRFMLVFFGYTHCPDVCPTTLAEISHVMDRLGGEAKPVQPVFISVDAARDTPEVMADYLQAFHPKIVGLTGTPEQVKAAARAYRVYHQNAAMSGHDGEHKDHMGQNGAGAQTGIADGGLVTHSGYVYLMSPDGDYVTHFSVQTGAEEMARAIRQAVAKFGSASQGNV